MSVRTKWYTKGELLAGMAKTKSVKGLARYMGCSYNHLRKVMKTIKNDDGITLFEAHLNPSGKGVPKFLKSEKNSRAKEPTIEDIINGYVDASSFNPQKIKHRLIEEGYLCEECAKCGFREVRVSDNKMPLILNFINRIKTDYRIENINLLCYNCFFLYIDEVFTEKDIRSMEDSAPTTKTTEAIKFELDDYNLQRLKEAGLLEPDLDNDPYSLVSRVNK